jgi:alginate O-acetyltransferase complex protein AlgI
LILIGLTALNYAGGLWLGRTRFRKPALALIVTADLGTLAFYKYIDFAVVNLNSVLFPAGISFAAPGILLPIGISFYTFEVISYIVDVYRGKIKPERSLLDFALLLAFFPRLVAGPIVRPADFLPQLKVIQTAQIGAGLQLVVIGMFQKLVIADYACSSKAKMSALSKVEMSVSGPFWGFGGCRFDERGVDEQARAEPSRSSGTAG